MPKPLPCSENSERNLIWMWRAVILLGSTAIAVLAVYTVN